MAKAEQKSLNSPDEVRIFEKGKIELVNIGGGVVGKILLEPGWRWSRRSYAKPRISSITSPGGCMLSWPTDRNWTSVPVRYRRCRRGTMPGS
jgi:hypothetical protein